MVFNVELDPREQLSRIGMIALAVDATDRLGRFRGFLVDGGKLPHFSTPYIHCFDRQIGAG
jgi:hypothetical protein